MLKEEPRDGQAVGDVWGDGLGRCVSASVLGTPVLSPELFQYALASWRSAVSKPSVNQP